MVHVVSIDLAAKGVEFPSDRVGIVLSQPYVKQSLCRNEPYRYKTAAARTQLAAVEATLRVAVEARHGAGKTHFTVFPEYSLPGLQGIQAVDRAISAESWPNATVIIGGTDALSAAHYGELVDDPATHVDTLRNGKDRISPNKWVNCAIIWVKDSNGRIERWLQPKLHPAWAEMDISNQHMFCGGSIFLFKGRLSNAAPFHFATVICFDWIASVGVQKVLRWLLADLHQRADGNQLPLSWLFVIQHNPKPSHRSFLVEVAPFFNQAEFPNALRNNACIVFANTAGKETPGRVDQYGGSSLVFSHHALFSSPTCLPTFCAGGPTFRDGSDLLLDYKDVFFRERGACIHSFAQINPASLGAGPANRSFAVENAHVFPISGGQDPRTPSNEVPASIKWLNDELDTVPSPSTLHRNLPLAHSIAAIHTDNIDSMRLLSPQAISSSIELAAQNSIAKTSDDWGSAERKALDHVVHTLDIVGTGFGSPSRGANNSHATVLIADKIVDVVAINGDSHEKCMEHFLARYVPSQRNQTLLISRDVDNIAWHQRFGSFLDPTPAQLGDERDITDPTGGSLQLGYEKLLTIIRQSTTIDEVKGGIRAQFAA